MARKDWLTQHGERHIEALRSDKGPEWRSAACRKSSLFEGMYPHLHRQERMVNRCLQHHLKKNGLLSPSQSGFRKNRSTEDQVTPPTQNIENGFQQKMKTLVVFVDLTKAFDKVWMEGLLFKLQRKRICSNTYSWIQSYLFQRSARVRLEGQTSSLVKIRGVPQGGVISPTLSIIFIDDICDQQSSHTEHVLHAGDLELWTKAEQVTTVAIRMQEAMNFIPDWAKEWLVMINRTKTEAPVSPCFQREKSSSCRSTDEKSTCKTPQHT